MLMQDLDVVKLLKSRQTIDVITSVLFDTHSKLLMQMQKRQTLDSDSEKEKDDLMDNLSVLD